jgi:hypothetical protein
MSAQIAPLYRGLPNFFYQDHGRIPTRAERAEFDAWTLVQQKLKAARSIRNDIRYLRICGNANWSAAYVAAHIAHQESRLPWALKELRFARAGYRVALANLRTERAAKVVMEAIDEARALVNSVARIAAE